MSERDEFEKFFTRLLKLEENSQLEVDTLTNASPLLYEHWSKLRVRVAMDRLKLTAYEVPRNAKLSYEQS